MALGGAVVFSGCTTLGEGITRKLDPHRHNADAPVEEWRGSWPIGGADVRRTGATDESLPGPDATVRRSTPIGEHRPDQPVLHPELAYVGVDDVEIEHEGFSGTVAVERSRRPGVGSYRWRNRGAAATVMAVRGDVVFESRDHSIFAVDATDGSVYWRNTRGSSVALPDGDTLYTAGESVVDALDAVTGEHLWSSELDLAKPTPLAVSEDHDALLLSYGNSDEGALYCIERSDGSVRWRYDGVGESYAVAVTDGQRAFTVGTDGMLHAVDLETGENVWWFQFQGESYERPAVAAGTVYALGTNDRRFVALDAGTGEIEWQVRLEYAVNPSPAVAGDHVLLQAELEGSEDPLHVFDATTGEREYGFQLPNVRFRSGLVQPVVADGTVFVVGGRSDGNRYYLYEVS